MITPLISKCRISAVDRHHGKVLWLTYEPQGEVQETVMLVGKGICYDTGGADVKAGGVMAGMHRDKCGAAAVAGFFKVNYRVSFSFYLCRSCNFYYLIIEKCRCRCGYCTDDIYFWNHRSRHALFISKVDPLNSNFLSSKKT